MTNKLIEQARNYNLQKQESKPPSAEEIELFLEFLRGNLEQYQVRKVIGPNIGSRFMVNMLEAYKVGLLEIKTVENSQNQDISV